MATILHKRKAADPSASDLTVGELAINTSDGGVFTKTSGGTVVELGSGGGGSGITVADDGTTYHSGTIDSHSDGAGANDNTAYGKEALKSLTSGDSNSGFGLRALKGIQSGWGNTAVGYYAGIDIGSSALKNTLMGFNAGDAVSGNNNIIIGYESDPSSNSVDNEITLGNSDITKFRIPGINFTVKDTTATEDYVLTVDANGEAGWEAAAGGSITSDAQESTVAGSNAGASFNTSGNLASYNTLFGHNAGTAMTSGDETVCFGSSAGKAITTASQNSIVGSYSGQALTTGGQNTVLGNSALYNATTSDKNICVGGGTGKNLTSGSGNVFVGFESGDSLTTGDENVGVGQQALRYTQTSSQYNIGIGFSAVRGTYNNSTPSKCIGIGSYSLELIQDGQGNTAVGHESGKVCTTGNRNTFIGWSTGKALTTASNSTIIGADAGPAVTTGSQNMFVGGYAGFNATTSLQCTGVGYASLFSLTTGEYNVGFGHQSIRTGTTFDENTALGHSAGYSVTGDKNTLIGRKAGYSGTNDLTSGDNNILIGYQAAASSATVSNEVTVGDTNITKFRVPGLNFVIKDTTATDNYVLTVDSNGEAGWEEAAGGGATGGGSDAVFFENGQSVTSDYTITNNTNAGSFGPITVNSGVTVTIGSGENWTVI